MVRVSEAPSSQDVNVHTIAVVGCDGAGKTSAVRLLGSRLRQSLRVRQVDKWDVLNHASYPQYRFLATDLPSFRRCVSNMPEVTRTLFLFWMLHGTLTPSAVADAHVLLLDGYWPKHAASEILYSGRRDLVEALVAIMPRPDLTLFLDTDPEVGYERRMADKATPLVPYECGLDESCSRTAFIRHQAATREILREWCSTHGWTHINANGDEQSVGDAVLSAADLLLPSAAGQALR